MPDRLRRARSRAGAILRRVRDGAVTLVSALVIVALGVIGAALAVTAAVFVWRLPGGEAISGAVLALVVGATAWWWAVTGTEARGGWYGRKVGR